MPALRSSTARLVGDYCPRALDHAEAGVPRDREVFQVGIAAHAVMESLCRVQKARGELGPDEGLEVATAVATDLVTTGRAFEGEPEPPMSPAAAAEGRDLALSAWAVHPASTADTAELGLEVDEDWRAVPYGSARGYWRAAIDLVGPAVLEDGDAEYQGLHVTDYKSAWPTGAEELETIQLRGQALVALAHAHRLGVEHPAFVRRRAINLRTRQAHESDLFLDDAGLAQLDTWRADVALVVAQARARGEDGLRPARPGARCLGCPYVLRCDPARAWLRGSLAEDADDVMLATRLAVADAIRQELWTWAREAAREGNIDIEGGTVGFVAKPKRATVDAAPTTLALAWFAPPAPGTWLAENGATVGLLRALDPSVTALERVAKALHPSGRDKSAMQARRDLVAACTTTLHAAEFGIHKSTETKE